MIRRISGRMIPARLAIASAAAVVIMVVLTPYASAHVRLSATDASPGGYGLLTFRVPTESDTASTTEIVISFPKKTPITSVSIAPVTGWTAKVETAKLDKPIQTDDGPVSSYVTRVDWKADSARSAIKPGEFGLFNITAGPLPKTYDIPFPTDQHYSNGTIVSWDQIATGTVEPDHPAPLLQLSEDQSSNATPAPTAQPTTPAATPADPLGVIGIALGAVAVLIAILALLRTRNRPAS